MAESGRGGGCASFTFSIEAICCGKDAALPDVICKPPPPFPVSTASILEHTLCSGKVCLCSCLDNVMKYMKNPKNFGFYNNTSHHFSYYYFPAPLVTVVSHI